MLGEACPELALSWAAKGDSGLLAGARLTDWVVLAPALLGELGLELPGAGALPCWLKEALSSQA